MQMRVGVAHCLQTRVRVLSRTLYLVPPLFLHHPTATGALRRPLTRRAVWSAVILFALRRSLRSQSRSCLFTKLWRALHSASARLCHTKRIISTDQSLGSASAGFYMAHKSSHTDNSSASSCKLFYSFFVRCARFCTFPLHNMCNSIYSIFVCVRLYKGV